MHPISTGQSYVQKPLAMKKENVHLTDLEEIEYELRDLLQRVVDLRERAKKTRV